MPNIQLNDDEVQRVITLLSRKCLHAEVYDLIAKIAQQAQQQTMREVAAAQRFPRGPTGAIGEDNGEQLRQGVDGFDHVRAGDR